MQKEHQQLSYPLLISTLSDLCKLRKTGTMYICTDDNHAARFTLKNGEIVACGFGSKRGMQALELVRSINMGKYSFAESAFPPEISQGMSSTKEVMDYLRVDQDPFSTSVAVSGSNPMNEQSPVSANAFSPAAVSSPIPQQPPTLQELVLETDKRQIDIPNPDDLMELLQEELALYIGPLGPAVCNMHADEILQTETREDLSAVIVTLAEEIGSSDEAQQFQNGVWTRLS